MSFMGIKGRERVLLDKKYIYKEPKSQRNLTKRGKELTTEKK